MRAKLDVSGSRSVSVTSLRRDRRTKLVGMATEKLIAADAPYIPIWNKTNVIVAQKGLDGLHLNPVGDFNALRDVKRITTRLSSATSAARD